MSEARKKYVEKVLTPMQEAKRKRELPEVSQQYAGVSVALREAIAKKAGVVDGSLAKMPIAQRRALRNAAQDIFQTLERKAIAAQKAFVLLVTACDSN